MTGEVDVIPAEVLPVGGHQEKILGCSARWSANRYLPEKEREKLIETSRSQVRDGMTCNLVDTSIRSQSGFGGCRFPRTNESGSPAPGPQLNKVPEVEDASGPPHRAPIRLFPPPLARLLGPQGVVLHHAAVFAEAVILATFGDDKSGGRENYRDSGAGVVHLTNAPTDRATGAFR